MQAHKLLLVLSIFCLTEGLTPISKRSDAMKLAIGACPCDDHLACNPIKRFGREVVAVSTDLQSWKSFDIRSLTTVSLEQPDAELMCVAHQQNVRVLLKLRVSANDLLDPSTWIADTTALVSHNFVDGLHIELEDQCLISSQCISIASQIIKNLKQELSLNGRDRLMLTVPWSPIAIDGRFHDFSALASVVDLVFVTSSDTRGQIMDRCIAGPNGHPATVAMGLNHHMDMGIPKNKLVMALSWLAYDYECSEAGQSSICMIESTEKGCSDSVASRIRVDQIPGFNATLERHFEDSSKSWFATYTKTETNKVHQVWFDDYESLSQKYHIARDMGLGGVGTIDLSATDAERSLALRTAWTK